MTMGAWILKKPGFNALCVGEADKEDIIEDSEDANIFRRVNPNLPPKVFIS